MESLTNSGHWSSKRLVKRHPESTILTENKENKENNVIPHPPCYDITEAMSARMDKYDSYIEENPSEVIQELREKVNWLENIVRNRFSLPYEDEKIGPNSQKNYSGLPSTDSSLLNPVGDYSEPVPMQSIRMFGNHLGSAVIMPKEYQSAVKPKKPKSFGAGDSTITDLEADPNSLQETLGRYMKNHNINSESHVSPAFDLIGEYRLEINCEHPIKAYWNCEEIAKNEIQAQGGYMKADVLGDFHGYLIKLPPTASGKLFIEVSCINKLAFPENTEIMAEPQLSDILMKSNTNISETLEKLSKSSKTLFLCQYDGNRLAMAKLTKIEKMQFEIQPAFEISGKCIGIIKKNNEPISLLENIQPVEGLSMGFNIHSCEMKNLKWNMISVQYIGNILVFLYDGHTSENVQKLIRKLKNLGIGADIDSVIIELYESKEFYSGRATQNSMTQGFEFEETRIMELK